MSLNFAPSKPTAASHASARRVACPVFGYRHRTKWIRTPPHALAASARERRRDGAYDWGIFEDPAQDGRFIETFLTDSWLEHLRQHERVTKADRLLEQVVRRFQIGEGPKTTHWVGAQTRE